VLAAGLVVVYRVVRAPAGVAGWSWVAVSADGAPNANTTDQEAAAA
jgi:hypothetical protein